MLTRKIKLLSISFLLTSLSQMAYSATCSCAGVSLADSVDMAGIESGKFKLTTRYSYHDISRLVAKKRTILDETGRERMTETLGLTLSYGINDKWGITGSINQVKHSRNISLSGQASEKTSGLGDSLILLSYSPLKISPFEKNEFAVGLGYRIASGENDEGSPFPFAEDLQPGQGSSGNSLWFHYAKSFSQKAQWQFFIDANYQVNGKNNRGYSFEKEINFSTGLQYFSDQGWGLNFAISKRKADPHSRSSVSLPNTGGEWLDLTPSFNYALNQNQSVGMSFRIPLSRDLNGELQFTTKSLFAIHYAYQW